MNTDWIKHRKIVAAYYRSANAYSVLSRKKTMGHLGLCTLDMQILEHIMEYAEENHNMKWFAERLGISTSVLTNHINSMVKQGLVMKYHTSDNKKNIILQVTPKGCSEYEEYVKKIQHFFTPVFEQLSQLSEADLAVVEKALNIWADGHIAGVMEQDELILIPVEKDNETEQL